MSVKPVRDKLIAGAGRPLVLEISILLLGGKRCFGLSEGELPAAVGP